ncbi:MAG: FMN-binding protein [Candidatus Staskawiczbacteria bacterium]|jgi:uncharacterized protein with FMN-binding domain
MNKKFLLVSGLVILVALFFVYEKFVATPQNTAPVINTKQTAANTAVLKDGTYLGNETSSIYGKAKVQIVVSGGKITDVQFVEFPNDRQATIMKSNMAMPIIKQEVIQAQSANVNTVSGATQTSQSFIQSAQSALSQAS